jgi:protocatechuate 3,4-dioxygenase, beta subunit
MVQVWTNGEDPANTEKFIEVLEKETKTRENAELKAFMMVITDPAKAGDVAKQLSATADKLKIERVGVTYLTPQNGGVRDYKINLTPEVKNTVFVYKRKRVVAKFINLKPDEKGLTALSEAIDKVTAE